MSAMTGAVLPCDMRVSRRYADVALRVLLLVTVICVFVPFAPIMPAAGLDPSWIHAMNEAVARGLVFGKDVIFTLGPYASVYTKAYHPATDAMMLSGGLYLAVSYWLCLLVLMREVRWPWVLAYCAVLATVIYLMDPVLFSYPLVVALACYRLQCDDARGWRAHLLVALLFAPLGFLPLIKGSNLALVGVMALLCALYFGRRAWSLAVTCLVAPVASMLFFWVLAGQPLAYLPDYFSGMAPIISGYTEAMSLSGKAREIWPYLLASASVIVAIVLQRGLGVRPRLFLATAFALVLFLAFKSGFVRHDGHAVIAGTTILLAALLLPLVARSRATFPVLALAVLSWVVIDAHYIKTSPTKLAKVTGSVYGSAWRGITHRVVDADALRREFDAAVQAIRAEAGFPRLEGSTDIYSYNQSYLLASGYDWSPRPVVQSYSVFAPELAEINRQHLLGERAPENVIFRVEPIDYRLPATEDGASWPALLEHYRPTRFVGEFLFLRRHASGARGKETRVIGRATHALGEQVMVPETDKLVYARIDIRPTLLGRLARVLAKPSRLQISLELKNGSHKRYRAIPGMLNAEFMLSPLVENAYEFGFLYGAPQYLSGKAVKSFSVTTRGRWNWLWRDDYTVTFKQMEWPAPTDVQHLYRFDGVAADVADYPITTADKCAGSIDTVNATTPPPEQVAASGLLGVHGWLALALDGSTPALPEATYVVLTDAQGKHTLFDTRPVARPDVAAGFGQAALDRSGFATVVDVSRLNGRYALSLAYRQAGRIGICPNFTISTLITN